MDYPILLGTTSLCATVCTWFLCFPKFYFPSFWDNLKIHLPPHLFLDDNMFTWHNDLSLCWKIERTLVPFLCLRLVKIIRIVKSALCPSIILIPLKNSLELLRNIDNSLEILRSPQGFSYLYWWYWFYDVSNWIHTCLDTKFLSWYPTIGSQYFLPFLPVLTLDKILKGNYCHDLLSTVKKFPFYRLIMDDDFFYSNLEAVQLILIIFSISTEFGICSSAVLAKNELLWTSPEKWIFLIQQKNIFQIP